MRYPFYNKDDRPEYCGYPGFRVNCSTPIPEIAVAPSENYYVVALTPDKPVATVARKDYWDGYCPNVLSITSINFALFDYDASTDTNLTLYYECLNGSYPGNQFQCANISSEAPVGYFVVNGTSSLMGTCKRKVIVPLSNADRITDSLSLMEAFRNGFHLVWKAENNLCDNCTASGGVCGQNTTTSNFTCYCPDQPYSSWCPDLTGVPHSETTPKFIILGDIPYLESL